MPLSMQQSMKLQQRLIMTPQMQQSIKLLQMNTIDLEELTQQELLENPFLEVEEDSSNNGAQQQTIADTPDSAALTAETADSSTTQESVSEGLESQAIEERPEQFTEVDVDWGDTFDGDSDADAGRTPEGEADWAEIFDNAGSRGYSPPPDDSDQRSFEETVSASSSLYERLMWQLRVSAFEGIDAKIAAFLIGCIDDRGYLQTNSTLGECAKRFRLDLEKVESILADIEANTPPTAELTELNAFIEERFTAKKERETALYLAGYLATAHARPGQNVLQKKPTMEACAELHGVSLEHVERVLMIVQEFNPPGVGARDLPECLMLQLVDLDELTPLAKEILMDHWPQMMRKQFRAIARALKAEEEEVHEIFRLIQKLQPAPGHAYNKEQTIYITPDVYVREVDGRYVTYLNEGEVAHLRLSNTYKNILLREDTPEFDPKEREYALDKYRAAVMFIKNVEKRRNTVLRVTEAIMDYQRDFLENGVESLRPLALAEIADQVGMHESTISRVTSNKYVDTPQGLFVLKFFFSSSIRSNSGEATSSRAIKNKISEMINDEDLARPLSDDKIAQRLATQGFSIARRTVAKYREQMRILPTNLRRKTK